MTPLVALTTTIDPQGGDYRQPMVALYAAYVSALERVGLTPVLVSPAHSDGSIRQLVGACAGLVLSGGADIDPARYGEEPIPELGEVNRQRDGSEWLALEAALGRDVPVLGICRGHQLLNVFLGGTLYQDIGAQMEGSASHLQKTPWGTHHHDVSVHEGSRLAEALEVHRFEINSYHHQAIRDLAPPLEVTATADDGLIEAVESRDHGWVMGVQWHPERHEASAAEGDPNLRVLDAFAGAVRAWLGRG
jgi:putative glutamine amidotransferase